MTRQTIREQVRILIDEYSDQTQVKEDAELNPLIDASFREVAGLFMAMDDSYYITSDHFDLEATVELYNLPANFIAMKSLENEEGDPIERLYNIAERSSCRAAEEVVCYYFQGNQIGFLAVPIVAAIYPYLYIRKPTPIADDNSEPDVPEFLGHDLIVVLTAIKALNLDEETNPELKDKVKELRAQIREIYYRRNKDFPRHIEGDDALDDI
jgi:hypothetical protein